MFALADVGEVAMEFDSGEYGEDQVDEQGDGAEGVGDEPARVEADVQQLGYSEEEHADVGQEEDVTHVVPSETQ